MLEAERYLSFVIEDTIGARRAARRSRPNSTKMTAARLLQEGCFVASAFCLLLACSAVA